MIADTETLEAESKDASHPKGGGKTRLLSLGDLDGRTKARRTADRLLADLLSDLGGDSAVPAGRRALAQHAAILNAMAEDQGARFLAGQPIDPAAYSTIVNALRRTLETAGLQRVTRDVTNLADYVRQRETEPVA